MPYTSINTADPAWKQRKERKTDSAITSLDAQVAAAFLNNPNINVKDNGVVGDGVTDDLAAFNAVLAALPSQGGVIYVPEGTYLLSGELTNTSATQSIALFGAGRGLSKLKWTAAGGINFDFTATASADEVNKQRCQIHGLTLLTSQAGGGNAIDLDWTNAGSSNSSYRTASIRDVEIYPAEGANDYWTKGIVLNNAWQARIDGVSFRGQTNTRAATAGIHLNGASIDILIDRLRTFFCADGVLVDGTCEGVIIDQSEMIYVDYGVRDIVAASQPLLHFMGGHISAFKGCIQSVNRTYGVVSDSLIQKRSDSAENFIGVDLGTGCSLWRIHDNSIRNAGTGGTEVGIQLKSGATTNQIHANTIQNQNPAIQIDSGSTSNFVHRNETGGSTTFVVNNGGSTNRIDSNMPIAAADGLVTFTDADTTPNVGGFQTQDFRTANTSGATSITDFTGGYTTQVIFVQANDNNTTLVHSAGLSLNGAVNFVMSSSDSIVLVRRNSSAWREVSRT